jgi:uncharacterized protein YxjI
MRYQMKQAWLSFGDNYAIRDEAGREAFFVKGRVFSWGDKLSMQDPSGAEVAFIAQKMLSWGPTYEIHRAGQLFAIMKKELFTFFKARFSIDVPGPNDYEAEGDFWNREYTFTRSGQQVARVSKTFFSWTDTYGIDIADGEDDITLLAGCVVIDLCLHGDKKND